MTSCRQPGESGAGRRAWQPVFLDGLRTTGNVSAAIAAGDWDAAATEALDSRWARQTGRRATDIAALLRGNGQKDEAS